MENITVTVGPPIAISRQLLDDRGPSLDEQIKWAREHPDEFRANVAKQVEWERTHCTECGRAYDDDEG